MENSFVDVCDRIKKSVVCVTVPTRPEESSTSFMILGAAFCIDPSGIFVSAKHIFHSDEPDRRVPEPEMIRITRFLDDTDGIIRIESSAFTHVALSKDSDIAFFRAFNSHSNNVEFYNSPEPSKAGTSIATMGFPLRGNSDFDQNPNVQTGIISRVDSKFDKENGGWSVQNYVLDIGVHGGNSGGPVFNHNGDIIGVLSSQRLIGLKKTDDKNIKTWSHLAHCVPFPKFKKDFDRYKELLKKALGS